MNEKKVFLTGDPHFGHKNIITYANRPFKSVEDMHEAIIRNWNNKIKNDDKVFILGDLTFTNQKNTTDIITKLNGVKYLIKGNHDIKPNQWYRDCGIKEVYDYPILLGRVSSELYEGYFLLSHEPIGFMPVSLPYINCYAHVHDSKNFLTFTPGSVCLSMERWNYTPVNFNIILLNLQRLHRHLDLATNDFKHVEAENVD